jgi:NAD(P)-dependent dehydrogenase (short-subunit alcohol dehydrogenase family)
MADEIDRSRTIALVTGANRGIGREIAVQLGALGMTVLLGCRDEERGTTTARELQASGIDACVVRLDVTDRATVEAAAKNIGERYARLDVLVNNAGIGGTLRSQLPRIADLNAVRTIFETNVFGVISVITSMMPLLRRSAAARIVNLSTSLASLSLVAGNAGDIARLPSSAAYVPSKAALNSLTQQYARDLRKYNILVNAADPGGCATDIAVGTGFDFTRTAAQGAAIAVRLATLGPDGPTGGFFSDDGPVPW